MYMSSNDKFCFFHNFIGPDNILQNVPFPFNNKQYVQTRIEGVENIFRNAIIFGKEKTYFGSSRGLYVLMNGDWNGNTF